MQDRLAQLLLVAPPSDTPWSGPPAEWQHPTIVRRDGRPIPIELPLFWYSPPWYQLPLDRAAALAAAVARMNILVAALRSDLSASNGFSPLHDPPQNQSKQGQSTQGQSKQGQHSKQEGASARPLPRLVPYRPERYGLSDRDFDGARIIDVRLTMHRDDTGRFAYSAAQIARWEQTPSGEPVSGGSWVPSATFPPDVASMRQLGTKLDQLRMLSPDAGVFVSIGPWRLEQELTAVVAAEPDGVILRLDELVTHDPQRDGLVLAVMTQQARRLLERLGHPQLPLWIVPGSISADDAAKLMALGASAVAIDRWCSNLWQGAVSQDHPGTTRLGYTSMLSGSSSYVSQWVSSELQSPVTRFLGLLSSLQRLPAEERLTSMHRNWCEKLGLRTRFEPHAG